MKATNKILKEIFNWTQLNLILETSILVFIYNQAVTLQPNDLQVVKYR